MTIKRAFIIVSVLVHVGVAWAATHVQERRQAHHATAVAVVGATKAKKPPPPKPPPPPPPPKHVARRSHAPKAEASAPEAAPPPKAPSGPAFSTGLALSNDGPGVDIGTSNVQSGAKVLGPDKAGSDDAEKPKALIPQIEHEHAEHEIACDEEPSKPEPIDKTPIQYTDQARADGVEGILVLRLTIGADGQVTDVKVLQSVDPSLDAAAIASAKQWRFKPAMACGKPVGGVTYTIANRFELGD